MGSVFKDRATEVSLWFGTVDRPLFGRLATPTGGTTLGGVLISPPLGRESRLARRALRSLALQLASDGYVSLRYEHFGSGNSSGSVDDDEFDSAWIEGVDQGVALLRSLEIPSVSAVGMRMGATIIGAAGSTYDLGLSSFAMWDPCESGRGYVREMAALGALRGETFETELDEPTKMVEYAFNDDATSRLSAFTLKESTVRPVAERVLVVVRDDRPVSSKFRARWESPHVEWATTQEQGTLFENPIPYAVQPAETISRIRAWLTSPASTSVQFSNPPHSPSAVVVKGSNSFSVRETVTELGPRKMFGVVSEPVGVSHGPLVVMVNGVHEDHIGPARLWVELSRRWAGSGLRCIRFDLSELGESPWFPGQPDRPVFDKTRSQDVADAVRAMIPDDPSPCVLIGYCSGAQLALEVAAELDARGVCAINPEVVATVFRNVDRVRNSHLQYVRSFVRRFETFLKRHRWEGKISRKFGNSVRSLAYPPKIPSALIKSGTEVLMMLSPEDLPRFQRIPILRRRLATTEHVQVEVVPGMDHNLLSLLGRQRAVAILDRYVLGNFPSPALQTEQI